MGPGPGPGFVHTQIFVMRIDRAFGLQPIVWNV